MKLGSWSSWKGHNPTSCLPLRVSLTPRPRTRAAKSLARFTRSISALSISINPAFAENPVKRPLQFFLREKLGCHRSRILLICKQEVVLWTLTLKSRCIVTAWLDDPQARKLRSVAPDWQPCAKPRVCLKCNWPGCWTSLSARSLSTSAKEPTYPRHCFQDSLRRWE